MKPETPDKVEVSTSPRVEEQRAQRRRRTDTTHEGSSKLSVNHDILDHEKFAYRFVNDTGGRINDFTVNDDWDKVPDPAVKQDADGLGTPIRKLVGANKDGSPVHAYLLRKPKEFYDEDVKKKNARRDELDAAIKSGQHIGPAAPGADVSNTYTPSGGGTKMTAKSGTYQP